MKYSVDYFIARGMSEKFAKYYSSCIEKESLRPEYDASFAEWALSKGFLFSSAKVYGLNENNFKEYLSDEDFYKTWPLNNWTKIWVDDKMTLKYILEGTKYSNVMPEYYFYTTPNGLLRELVDNPYKGFQNKETLINCIKHFGCIACKPNNGTASEGFFKLSFDGSSLYINDEIVSEKEIGIFVEKHPNYIFTEYLYPEKSFAKVFEKIHTLRVVVLNIEGNNPKIIGGYLRFGTINHGEANHLSNNLDCKASFDFVTDVNFENGYIGNSKSIYFDRVVNTPKHPDSGVLIDGNIPNWSDIKDTILGISKYLFGLEYIGFDLGITDKGVKLMEINTHPGIKYMQIFKSLYADNSICEYFRNKLKSR